MVLSVMYCLMLTCIASATIQERDELVLDKKAYEIYQNPMNGYWHGEDEPAMGREKYPAFEFVRSTNWKGYSATWSIENERLVLTSLSGRIAGKSIKNEQILQKAFPVHATWFSGKIFLEVGGYDREKSKSRYVIEFTFRSGDLTETRIHNTCRIPSTWNGTDEGETSGDADHKTK